MSVILDKKAEKVGIILAKRGLLTAPTVAVQLFIDESYSMRPLYDLQPDGPSRVQGAINDLMGVGVKFDDDGEIDIFGFDSNVQYYGVSKPVEGDYDQVVPRYGLGPKGGTAYVPVIKEATKRAGGGFLSKKKPTLALILTDGEPGESYATISRAVEAAQKNPIYFSMVGVGGGPNVFPTIKRLADDFPNVGDVYLPYLNLSEDELYEQIITQELVDWMKKF